jgi:peroxiredoxin
MDTGKNSSIILKIAGVYNLLWGGFIIVFPFALFDFAALERPIYPGIWQCVGMIVGVYGLAYWIASYDYIRHWPIVLVGLLGKILGPIGFIESLTRDIFNIKFGLTIIFNDLIWWVPFCLLLWEALKGNTGMKILSKKPAIRDLKLPGEESLIEESKAQPHLLVLVRHRGCTFCREALSELSKNLDLLKERGLKTYVVHMGSIESGQLMKKEFELDGVEMISDPDQLYYQALGARRGSFKELFGPRVWKRGFQAGVLKDHGLGKLEGDGLQLGGVFLVESGRVNHLHDPCDAADVENWNEILDKNREAELREKAPHITS